LNGKLAGANRELAEAAEKVRVLKQALEALPPGAMSL